MRPWHKERRGRAAFAAACLAVAAVIFAAAYLPGRGGPAEVQGTALELSPSPSVRAVAQCRPIPRAVGEGGASNERARAATGPRGRDVSRRCREGGGVRCNLCHVLQVDRGEMGEGQDLPRAVRGASGERGSHVRLSPGHVGSDGHGRTASGSSCRSLCQRAAPGNLCSVIGSP